MAKTIKPSTHDGMTGVQMTDYTTQELLDKATAITEVYEQPSKIFLSGAMDVTGVSIPAGTWVEVTYDAATQDFTFDYTGPVHAQPMNGTTWDLSEVMVPIV